MYLYVLCYEYVHVNASNQETQRLLDPLDLEL